MKPQPTYRIDTARADAEPDPAVGGYAAVDAAWLRLIIWGEDDGAKYHRTWWDAMRLYGIQGTRKKED